MFSLIERAQLGLLRARGYRSRTVDSPAGRLHALEVSGRGPLPCVVLLHGLGSCGADFAPLVRHLRGHAQRVVAVDLPGHGRSPMLASGWSLPQVRRHLQDSLHKLTQGPAVVFGNSLGGLAALHYALDRPDAVLGLVLASPAGAPIAEDALPAFTGQFAIEGHRQALKFIDRVTARRHPMRHLFAAGVHARLRRPEIQELLAGIRSEDLLRPQDLTSLEGPVLLSWGRQERVLPRAHLDFFRTHLPEQAQVTEPDDVGHAPHLDSARDLAGVIVDFARRLNAI